jgi:hypothetical protein
VIKLFSRKSDPSSQTKDHKSKDSSKLDDFPVNGNKNNVEARAEFLKLVEPLIHIAREDEEFDGSVTQKSQTSFHLRELAIAALVNLCNYSEDIKEIFFQKKGLDFILTSLATKREQILILVLRLILTLVVTSEGFT